MKITPIGEPKKVGRNADISRFSQYELTAENAEELELMSDIDLYRYYVRIASVKRSSSSKGVGYIATSAIIEIDPGSKYSLDAQAGIECLRSLRKLKSLIIGQTENDGLVGEVYPRKQDSRGTVDLRTFIPASWRCVTGFCPKSERIGIGFNFEDGRVFRVALDLESARAIAEEINYHIRSQSPISAGIPSRDVSPHEGV